MYWRSAQIQSVPSQPWEKKTLYACGKLKEVIEEYLLEIFTYQVEKKK